MELRRMKNYYLSNDKHFIRSNSRTLICFLRLIEGGVAWRDPKSHQDYKLRLAKPGRFEVGYYSTTLSNYK